MSADTLEILLIEDNPADAELTLRALRKSQVANNIHLVRDGEEALDFLFCRRAYAGRDCSSPRVVLLDLKLPKLDGAEVLQAMRNDARTKAIPVVVLTSSKQPQDVEKMYQLGVNSYIQKPVDFDQFRQTIRQLGLYWLIVNQPPIMG